MNKMTVTDFHRLEVRHGAEELSQLGQISRTGIVFVVQQNSLRIVAVAVFKVRQPTAQFELAISHLQKCHCLRRESA